MPDSDCSAITRLIYRRLFPAGGHTGGNLHPVDHGDSIGPTVVQPGGPPGSERFTKEIVVPEMPGGRSDDPLNLGTITLQIPPKSEEQRILVPSSWSSGQHFKIERLSGQ